MTKDYTEELYDEMLKIVYAQDSDKFPKNIFVLYATINDDDKPNEYLVRGDGELITKNKISTEKPMIAFKQVNPRRRVENIEQILSIPQQYRIYFLEKSLQKGDKTLLKPNQFVTAPILLRRVFTEEQTRKYLE